MKLLLLGLLLSSGCNHDKDPGDDTAGGPDDTGTDTSTDTSTDTGGTDTGEPWTGDTMPFTATWHWPGYPPIPIAGVTVAIDDGEGGRRERVTDADGVAQLPVNWSLGPATVVVEVDGFVQSLAGVPEGTEALVFGLPFGEELRGPEVLVGGDYTAAEGDTGFTLQMSTLDPYSEVCTFTSDRLWGDWCGLNVTVDEVHTFMATRFTSGFDEGGALVQDIQGRWLVEDVLVEDGTSVDFDLTGPSWPRGELAGTFDLPDDPWTRDLAEVAQAFAMNHALVTAAGIGATTWSAWREDGEGFAFTGDYLDHEDHPPVGVMLQATSMDGSVSSVHIEPGLPDTWAAPPVLLPFPSIQTPPDDLSPGAVIALAPKAVDTQRCVQVFTGSAYDALLCDQSSDDIVVPTPPSSVPADHLYGATHIYPAYIGIESMDLGDPALQRMSLGDGFRL